jgi:predicted transcriptional regulator
MAIIHQRITIVKIRKPVRKTVNEELQWLGGSLGLFGLRDKDKSCFRIFIELLKMAKQNLAISSDELAHRTKLSRGTVVHHLHKLMDSGIIINQDNRYLLRVGNLEAVVEELQKDVNRTINDLKQIAKEIDSELGM